MSDAVNKPTHYNQGSIECIEAMKIVLTPEEFRGYLKGNVFKYLWREKDKNGNEDIRKGKSYYDWLIELIDESEQQKASDLQSLKDHPFGKLKEPVIKQPTTTEPPGGWRFLERGETVRDGDMLLRNGILLKLVPDMIGSSCYKDWMPIVRRNRFEVGEKVIYIPDQSVWTYISEINDGPSHPKSAHVASGSTSLRACVTRLAPYIEETT